MGSAYNSAQTIQGEGGDFNIVNTYLLNVYNEATLNGDVTFTSDVTFESDVLVQGKIQASEFELVTETWQPYNPPKLLSELFDTVAELEGADANGIKTTEVELGTFDTDGNFVRSDPRRRLSRLFDDVEDIEGDINSIEGDITNLDGRVTSLESAAFDSVDLTPITTRLNALEAIDFSQPDLSNLTTGLSAVQTRTATLEGLIGQLNNDNPTDTILEHRITNLESKITALISVYQSIKAIHNMPINLS